MEKIKQYTFKHELIYGVTIIIESQHYDDAHYKLNEITSGLEDDYGLVSIIDVEPHQ